jgi:predicted  nucleic acid-binding Zn-ribbon protein
LFSIAEEVLDVDAKPYLQRLLRIQELALEIQAARAVVIRTPSRIEEIESRFRDRNAEYVAVRDRNEELEKDQRDRQGELSTLEESLKKYTDSLMQVKNQREYAAMLKEIDTVKAQISTHEDTVLKDMEEIEKLKTDLEARSAHIAEERTQVATESAQVEADAAAGREQIERCETERARIESELPNDLVENVRRVEDARQGIFLAKADKEMCQVCFVRIRPQVYQEIRQNLKIHTCSNCRRYLYHEGALRPVAEPRLEPQSPGLEAANGGAV